jgi:PAS domain S-box-containing protein
MGLSSLHDPTKAFPSSTVSDPPAPTPVLQKETKSDKEHYLVLSGWLVSGVIAVALFVIDLLSPLGYAVCMLYAVPILLTRLTPDLQSTMIMAGATVSLTWAGAELSPGAIAQHDSSNRIMATALLLGITWILVTQKQSARQVKAAQEARYESEERLRLFIEHAPVALAMFDRDMRYLAVSRRWITDYGLNERDVIGQSHYEILPEIPERWRAVHQRGLEGEIIREEEDRFERADGTARWFLWEVRPWKTDGGRVGGIVIFTEDITERKETEQELRNHQNQLEDLTAKLLTAQEEERKRIARDLHDDFTQQLAALTIDLQRQARLASESGTPPASHLVQMGKKTEQITTDLQRMAHRLHSSLLEHVGLEAAFRECVDEFSARTGLTTELVMRELPSGISLEQATCLYRVLQESLQNVMKHAKASNILVRLFCARNGLELCIQDDGLGLTQPEEGTRPKGLGFTSMAERVKTLHGTFCVKSTAGFGTEIHAWVPLSGRSHDQ